MLTTLPSGWSFLSRHLAPRVPSGPDGRMLHHYAGELSDHAALGAWLRGRLQYNRQDGETAAGFVIWAAERIRRDYPGGTLSWEFVYQGLDLPPARAQAIALVETGLALLQRPLRRNPDTNDRRYLFSLLVEGGVPETLLEKASACQSALLGVIAEIEETGTAHVRRIARRWLGTLPKIYDNEDFLSLLADLALALVEVRRKLPSGISGAEAEAWADRNHPDWQSALPMRLSPAARKALLWPALQHETPRTASGNGMIERVLRLGADGESWIATLRIADGTILPAAMLPVPPGTGVLRLVGGPSLALRATAEGDSWRLSTGRGTVWLPLELDRACVLSVFADGQPLGECTLAGAWPEPLGDGLLWRGPAHESAPIELRQVASGRTRAAKIWLLQARSDPAPAAQGLDCGAAMPGAGGLLWPISGRGRLGDGRAIETGSETEPGAAVLLPLMSGFGNGWQLADGTPLWRMPLRILAQNEDGTTTEVTTRLKQQPWRGRLGGVRLTWVDAGGETRAALKGVLLPADLRLDLAEIQPGVAALRVTNLAPGWLALAAAEGCTVTAHGRGQFILAATANRPARLQLVLSDPDTGARLRLEAPWPARDPVIFTPDNGLLQRDTSLSLARLEGWQGMLPARGGALHVQLSDGGRAIGFAAAGHLRLSAWSRLLARAGALAGPDGRVHLRLVHGTETPRLTLGHYDWAIDGRSGRLQLGDTPVTLRALTLEAPHVLREITTQGALALIEWLGDEGQLWFIQGQCPRRGTLRPMAWSAQARPFSSRAARIAGYVAHLREMTTTPTHPGWSALTVLLRRAREAGNPSALDQVQALTEVPEAAIGLLLRVATPEVAATLDLDMAAAFWWLLLPIGAWRRALEHHRADKIALLVAAGQDPDKVRADYDADIARRVALILLYQPGLSAHLGMAMRDVGITPLITTQTGQLEPLLRPGPEQAKAALARQCEALAKRFHAEDGARLPQGTRGLQPRYHALAVPPNQLNPLHDLWQAPLIAADQVLSPTETPAAPELVLQLLALRQPDPQAFDTALSLFLQIHPDRPQP